MGITDELKMQTAMDNPDWYLTALRALGCRGLLIKGPDSLGNLEEGRGSGASLIMDCVGTWGSMRFEGSRD